MLCQFRNSELALLLVEHARGCLNMCQVERRCQELADEEILHHRDRAIIVIRMDLGSDLASQITPFAGKHDRRVVGCFRWNIEERQGSPSVESGGYELDDLVRSK